ncbi:ABC transporter ATP-binding protein [Advenella mimigardefordensis]|uniref:ABC transporter ATP-binding protein n=1 Tax=Advenella mimigardefordensis (strain DSM 17166 / LMG 22922 / DPN7) TaxID=1247726 RepID=W0PK18_ADVMD|nr:ABC transporter ATP-binding protein [Advenella mimigardefordensis]AHG65328.1 ABC transporter ATP-binding protein [Advenella mimigardefordensis DPN7]
MTSMLNVSGLSVSYGHVAAVRDVSLQVPDGSIVSVIGPNGAGKTTLLSALMGLRPSQGVVTYDGVDLQHIDVESRVEQGICLVPEQRELFGEMSVYENLLLGAYAKRADRTAVRVRLDNVYARFPRLHERKKQKAYTLSGGERQMLALGRALMSSPRLLMLDEPSLGLAPLIVRDILQMVASLRDDGVSVLLIEQNARAALQISDFGYVLETGEIALEGAAAQLLDDPRIIQLYLGGGQQ